MKYQDFKKIINKPYFSTLDIVLKDINVYNYQLSLWQKKGYLGHLKRGLYFFTEQENLFSIQEISFLLYDPSYISMESALSYYGIIPEMVYAQTAISTKTTRKFSNKFGHFIYRHINPRLFFGYNPVELSFGKYLMADPEKALLDYLYLNLGKINDENDIVELRINCLELKKIINIKKINAYLREFNMRKLERTVNKLFEICSHLDN